MDSSPKSCLGGDWGPQFSSGNGEAAIRMDHTVLNSWSAELQMLYAAAQNREEGSCNAGGETGSGHPNHHRLARTGPGVSGKTRRPGALLQPTGLRPPPG